MTKKPDTNRPNERVGQGLWTPRAGVKRRPQPDVSPQPDDDGLPSSGPFARAALIDQLTSRSVSGRATANQTTQEALESKTEPHISWTQYLKGSRRERTIETEVPPSPSGSRQLQIISQERSRESIATVATVLLILFSMVAIGTLYLGKESAPGLTNQSTSVAQKSGDDESELSVPVLDNKAQEEDQNSPQDADASGNVMASLVSANSLTEVAVSSSMVVPETMLEQAANSILARFDTAEQGYRDILSIDPEHPEALAGMAIVRERQLQRVNQVINRSLLSNYRGNIDAIGQSLGIAQGLITSQLDDLTAMCLAIDQQISDARKEQLPWWIALANRRIRDGILTVPETGSALYAFRRAESIDKKSTKVIAGLENLRQKIILNSGNLLDAGQRGRALADLQIAQEIRSDPSTELLIKQIRISGKNKDLTPESFVIEADALITEGRLVGDDSALAVLNQALVLDPGSKIVDEKRRELANRLVKRAENVADGGQFSDSLDDLKVALAIEPGNSDAKGLLQKILDSTVEGAASSDGNTEAVEENLASIPSSQSQAVDELSGSSPDRITCERDFECIGIAVDVDDTDMSKMASEFSAIVTGSAVGTVVKPTGGPVASTVNLLSKSNAGLSVLPSDMLRYTDRSGDPVLARAGRHLRYIMSLGQNNIYLIANESINTPADLTGKHVVLGPRDDSLWVVANNLLHAYGAEPGFTYEFDSEVAIDQLVNGRVDAVFLMQADQKPLSSSIKLALEDANRGQSRFQLVALPVPPKTIEYESTRVTVNGLGEDVNTIAMKPILVSYDFAQRDTAYFRKRCDELAQVGSALISQIDELRDLGHPAWSSADWVSQCGDWRRDECFFRDTNRLADASK